MQWLGRKRVAFIPVLRSRNQPPDVVPVDFADQILKRVLFNPVPQLGNADWSLRAWLRAASSGRADIDPVVLGMQTSDTDDTRPGEFEAELGNQLRSDGFDHAVMVTLSGGGGTNVGFWSRVRLDTKIGTWAMEIVHGICGFPDLYHYDNDVDPADRAIGTFDEMSAEALTHPTIFTKTHLGWADPPATAVHSYNVVNYNLQLVALAQPPAGGRVAAVKIGSGEPHTLIEARTKSDAFDAGISSEGVIAYRVQWENPKIDHRPGFKKPLFLLTKMALKTGESATLDNGVKLTVAASLPGGFAITVNDPNVHLVDRTAEFDTPLAASPPTACVIPGLGVNNIAYRDTSGRLHELWRDRSGAAGTTDLTTNANAPTAIGNPFAYVDTSRNTEILLFRGGDGTVRSLYWSTGAVGHDNLGGTAGAPKAAGDPVGYYVPSADAHHVIYRTGDGHLHELSWIGIAPAEYGGNLTAGISAPTAAGDPAAFCNAAGVNIVVYRSADRRIFSLYWTEGPSGLDDLSGVAGTPPADGDPMGYYTAHDDTHQVVYVGSDGNLWELYWQGAAPVVGWALTASGAPAPVGTPVAYYSSDTNTKHVVYRSADGRLHEIWWVPGGGIPAYVDITARYGGPPAADRPAAFTVEGRSTQHVAYRGADKHIYEVVW